MICHSDEVVNKIKKIRGFDEKIDCKYDDPFEKIIKKACQEPTLLEALTYACICESERIVKQATTNFGSGRDGAGWDTCFRVTIKAILDRYDKQKSKCGECSHLRDIVKGNFCEMFEFAPENLPCAQHDMYAELRKETARAILENPQVLVDMVKHLRTGG